MLTNALQTTFYVYPNFHCLFNKKQFKLFYYASKTPIFSKKFIGDIFLKFMESVRFAR